MSFKYLFVTIWILLLGHLTAPVRTEAAKPTEPQDTLTREQEMELAASGAPEHLRKDCAVYVLDGKKYVKGREGSNGITCVVFRDGPDASEPICYDEEGARSNMLVDMKRSELRRQGISEEEIEKKVSEGYKTGEFKAPRRSGIAYMLSDYNFIYNPGSKASHYPPHLMFYAPYLKNSDIGARKEDFGSTMVPWVLNEGTPDAYIIVVPGGEVHQH
jgi:hypothetical protein